MLLWKFSQLPHTGEQMSKFSHLEMLEWSRTLLNHLITEMVAWAKHSKNKLLLCPLMSLFALPTGCFSLCRCGADSSLRGCEGQRTKVNTSPSHSPRPVFLISHWKQQKVKAAWSEHTSCFSPVIFFDSPYSLRIPEQNTFYRLCLFVWVPYF